MNENNQDYNEKEWEEHQQREYEEKKQLANKHREYLSSINKVIEKTCEKQCYEIDEIWDFYCFFVDLKLPKSLNNCWYVTSMYIPAMISLFLDLLTIGNYNSTHLPLRKILESFMRAIYFDLKRENISSIINWIEKDEKILHFKGGVTKEITQNKLVRLYDPKFKSLVEDMYSKLSFKIHKPEIDIKFFYEYDKIKFKKLFSLFNELIEMLLITLVLNFPETYNLLKYKLGYKKDKIKFLLKNS